MNRLLLVGVGVVLFGLSDATAQDKPAPSAPRERIELAKKIYRDRILDGLERRSSPPQGADPVGPRTDPLLNESMAEELHRWSIRWMEAEMDVATDRTGRIAAAQTHLDRMISVESGKMVRKVLADHPAVKELEEFSSKSLKGQDIVDIPASEILKLGGDAPEAMRRFPEVARYFRLEAEALLAREKAVDSKPRSQLP